MNLPRLRELAHAGLDGSLRPEEAKELFEALPEVFNRYEATNSVMDEIYTWYIQLMRRVHFPYPQCGALWDKLYRARNG